jgi:deazaflavin-dependent oxidoreductase (nitroreductase family)
LASTPRRDVLPWSVRMCLRLARYNVIRHRVGPLLARLDCLILWTSRGRWSVVGPPRVPMLVLTTRGRRTGRSRRVVLTYHDEGDTWYIVGTNWGRPYQPRWSDNLLSAPDATVISRPRSGHVRAVLLHSSEKRRLWTTLLQTMPAWDVNNVPRDVRVFALQWI